MSAHEEAQAWLQAQFGEGWRCHVQAVGGQVCSAVASATRGGVQVAVSRPWEPVERPGGIWEAVRACVKDARDAGIETRMLTCVYCGHEYPPGTTPSQASALTQHIERCESHPLSKEIAHADRLAERVRNLEKLVVHYKLGGRAPAELLDALHGSAGLLADHDARRRKA